MNRKETIDLFLKFQKLKESLMKNKIILIVFILIIALAGCSKKSTGPDNTLNQDLVANWTLVYYSDEDGEENLTGFINIESDGKINGEFVDTEDNLHVIYSGTATSTDTLLTTNITQSSSTWLETGIYEWNYQISGQTLLLNGVIDGEVVSLRYSNGETPPNNKGSLAGTVTDGRNLIKDVDVEIIGTNLSAQTDSNGNFLIQNIPIGTYSVKFSKENYENYTESNVTIENEQTTTLNIQLTVIAQSYGTVSGFVADVSTQTAIIGATVVIEETSFSAQTDENGLYIIENIPVGHYLITCSKEGFDDEQLEIDVVANNEINADFLLIPQGSTNYGNISGFVTNMNSEAVVNVSCQVQGLYNVSFSLDDGSYNILMVPAGTYSILFSKPGYEDLIVENITVVSGEETNLDVQISQIAGTGNLVCYVENNMELPMNGVTIEILGTSYAGVTGLTGIYTFQNIPTGQYNVRVSKVGYTTQTIENVEILASLPQYIYITLLN